MLKTIERSATEGPVLGFGTSVALHSALLVCLALLYRPGAPSFESVQPPHQVVTLVSPPREPIEVASLIAATRQSMASIEEPPPAQAVGRFDTAGAPDAPAAVGDASGRILTGTLPDPAGAPIAPSGDPGSIVVGNLGAGEPAPASGPPGSGTVRLSPGFDSGTGGEGGEASGSAGAASPRLLSAPFAPYTEEARRLGVHGVVVLKVVLRARGGVHVLGVLHSLGYGLDETAQAAAKAMHFSPARNGAGQPVDSVATVTVVFDLT